MICGSFQLHFQGSLDRPVTDRMTTMFRSSPQGGLVPTWSQLGTGTWGMCCCNIRCQECLKSSPGPKRPLCHFALVKCLQLLVKYPFSYSLFGRRSYAGHLTLALCSQRCWLQTKNVELCVCCFLPRSQEQNTGAWAPRKLYNLQNEVSRWMLSLLLESLKTFFLKPALLRYNEQTICYT